MWVYSVFSSYPVGLSVVFCSAGNPAPGYRYRDTGALSSVGDGGYSWASTVGGTNGLHLRLTMTWLNPSSAGTRASSFPLRCLSE